MPAPVDAPGVQPFVRYPHSTFATFVRLVMASLFVEPFATLFDTVFAEDLGATSAVRLGQATAVLSRVLWIFNFLGTGTRTEVSQTIGAISAGKPNQVGSVARLGFLFVAMLGLGLTLITFQEIEKLSASTKTDATARTDTHSDL